MVDAAVALHEASIVIDGLTFYYDGPSPRLRPEWVTATNVTAAETSYGFADALADIEDVRRAASRDPGAVLVLSASDIEAAKRGGKVGIIIGLQASLPVDEDLGRVRVLHDLGVRIMQLTYNDRTYAGDGCLEPVDGGLSRLGRAMIAEMADVKMLLDLSHVGRRTSLEAIDACPVPMVISHANPLAVTASPRNLTDEQIQAVASRGGVIGACSYPPICWKNRRGVLPTTDDVLDHLDYLVEVAGIDHVGIATDSACTADAARVARHSKEFASAFPGITEDYDREVKSRFESPAPVPTVADLLPVTQGLLGRGYQPDDVQKVLGGNFMRVFREVWGA